MSPPFKKRYKKVQIYKEDRCLARYSPRAETDRPYQLISEPVTGHIWAQISPFGSKKCIFWAEIQFFWAVTKFDFWTPDWTPERQLVCVDSVARRALW